MGTSLLLSSWKGKKRREECSLPEDLWLQWQLKLYRMLKQIDVIMPTGGFHLGWGESLICHSLSALLVPAGLVAGSKQDRWDFSWVHLLMCPYVLQQNTCLFKKMFTNHPTTFHLTSHHHIMIMIDSESWSGREHRMRFRKSQQRADKRQWSRRW